MKVRSVIFWTHVCAALCAGAVVLIMAGTGVLLAFERQITHWSDMRGIDGAPPAPAARLLPPDSLAALARAGTGRAATSLRIHADPDAPVEIALGRQQTLFMNGYTGELLGTGSPTARAFFASVEGLHRWLALPGDARRAGRAVTGVANLVFLFMVLSGIVLWWPRTHSLRRFRNVLLFRRGLRARARDFNWHNVIGFWSAVPLLLIITSGVVVSYGWAGALVERWFDSARPPAAAASLPATHAGDPRGTDVLVEQARRRAPDWRSITLRLPARDDVLTFVVDRGNGGQPHLQHVLRLSLAGEELSWTSVADEAPAARARTLLRFVHTGELFGVPGQLIAAAVSAGVLMLGWTGGAMALRRFRSWRARRAVTP
jgi:uncharacterized iron-regulated membrane protein